MSELFPPTIIQGQGGVVASPPALSGKGMTTVTLPIRRFEVLEHGDGLVTLYGSDDGNPRIGVSDGGDRVEAWLNLVIDLLGGS
jgi:hypothetical protein